MAIQKPESIEMKINVGVIINMMYKKGPFENIFSKSMKWILIMGEKFGSEEILPTTD